LCVAVVVCGDATPFPDRTIIAWMSGAPLVVCFLSVSSFVCLSFLPRLFVFLAGLCVFSFFLQVASLVRVCWTVFDVTCLFVVLGLCSVKGLESRHFKVSFSPFVVHCSAILFWLCLLSCVFVLGVVLCLGSKVEAV